jgi:heme/copper-type cytochrome/quinol oxidase subunit 4
MSFSITNAKIDYYLNLGLQIAGFICVLMLYFAAVVYYPYQDVIEYDMGTEYTILKGLSLIQFMVALMYFGLWMKNHMYLAIKKY